MADILAMLIAERDKLDRAIAALQGPGVRPPGRRGPGRPAKKFNYLALMAGDWFVYNMI